MTRRPRIGAAFLVAIAVVAVVAVALPLAHAAARPGGGSSYSGGSSRRSSGGGSSHSGDGGLLIDVFAFLFRLCLIWPQVGIPILLFVVVLVVAAYVAKSGEHRLRDWQVGGGEGATEHVAHEAADATRPSRSERPRLEQLRTSDENFSIVLLEDFLSALYVEVHAARGRQALAAMSAYIAPGVQAALASPGLVQVRDILVGAMRFTRVELGERAADGRVRIELDLETNYTEVRIGSQERSYYAHERWRLSRKVGVRSRTPDRVRIFPCPSCGAPLDKVIAGQCRHCGQNVSTGAFDWIVDEVAIVSRELRPPLLTGTTEERGNELLTVIDREAPVRLRALSSKDPAFNWDAFTKRVGLVFASFQTGWAARNLAPMRPYLTDNLFQVQTYWVEAYERQNLRNVTERARITDIQLARVSSDLFFDAITIRVFATGLDYTVTDRGRLAGGNKSRERVYSEYWTMVRGTARRGPTRTEPVCPNCGAPLAVNMAGICQYCHVKVCSGEFDWVLSRIEQDEAYEG